jgi:putative ABC transport system substrate-binding protein
MHKLIFARRRFLRGGLAAAGLVVLSGCGVGAPRVAQPARIPRIALVHIAPPDTIVDRVGAFQQGLRDFGYVEGQNIVVEYRSAEGQPDRVGELVADLVQSRVDVIVTAGPQATRVAKEITSTLPIVMAWDLDPVGSGSVASLARPGGNVTGLTSLAPATIRKGLELVKEIVPGLSRLAVFGTSDTPGNTQALRELEAAARVLGIDLHYLEIREPADVEPAFRAASGERAEAILVQSGAPIRTARRTIVELAARDRLPLIGFAEEGGLLTYGVSYVDLDRRAAGYVDKILKGAKPADLPVEQPTKFDFIINLKTAQALGLTIPPSVLRQATEVIE